MVKALHEVGLEVILDVVFNHSCEGNQLGPTLSFRGIDNPTYYWLQEGDRSKYVDFTGCGNSLNVQHPQVLKLVMDSLRYWVNEMHVDGFRFDLATTLARTHRGGFNPAADFFSAIYQDPLLSRVKLIAEPWDLGPDGYKLGNFPLHFAEWNDRYRSAMRRFWRGDGGQLADVGYHVDLTELIGATSRSTSSPRTTASPCGTWSATARSTTSRTGSRTATALTTTSRPTGATKARPTTRW